MPYDNYTSGAVRGHYAAAQRSGELAATIGALGHLARIRWTDASSFLVLKRVRVGYTISAAVTAAVEFAFRVIKVTGFSVDFTTAITQVAPSRDSTAMQPSLMQNAGPGISTTAVMSGQTLTADAAPFAVATFSGLTPVTATGTAVLLPVGTGAPMATLYEQTADGQHPKKLTANEGFVVQPVLAGPATGTWALYVQWEWLECAYNY